MRPYILLALAVCACTLAAQPTGDFEVSKARADLERVRGLAQSGAAAAAQVQKAEEALADAEDAAYLRKTLYGKELTETQADEMVAAAGRRMDRRQTAYERAEKLFRAGAVSRLSLAPLVEDVGFARKERELAETRAGLVRELAAMVRLEEEFESKSPAEAPSIAERFDGDGRFDMVEFAKVEQAFEQRFGKALPVSALGETAVHRSLGFDHRGRVDVALHPDSPEGAWLRNYMVDNRLPFFAFRQAVPGKATGAHFHLGPSSQRFSKGG